MLSAGSLKPIDISSDLASELATAHYNGEGRLHNLTLVKESTLETRKFKLPAWKADFADEQSSSLYLSASTGQVFGIKTDSWRLFDIFWMLHIMDYSERNDMNNALVIFIALVTSFIALSGVGLLFSVFSWQDFNLLARFRRVPLLVGSVSEGHSEIFVTQNKRLFDVLEDHGYRLPSSCGGGGSCGLCQVTVEPSVSISSADREQLTEQQLNDGQRLACQLPLSSGLKVDVPDQVLEQQLLSCRIISSQFKTPFIKELILEVPEQAHFKFNAGEYVMVHIPAGKSALKDIVLPGDIKPLWDALHVQQYQSLLTEPVSRSYSMANPPSQNRVIVLNVRLSLPQDASGESGKASSYLFSLTEGDMIKVSGPFGHFHAAENQNEMIFIGGGAGMAPLKSHILNQLESLHNPAKISFWYGARSENEVFYQEIFEWLQQKHANFSWHLALSDGQSPNNWSGFTGMIHQVVYDNYLENHRDIERCDFYICGPPAMNKAVLELLNSQGVKKSSIHLDDFGS